MVISEFDQARERPLVRHPELEKKSRKSRREPGTDMSAIRGGSQKGGTALFSLAGK